MKPLILLCLVVPLLACTEPAPKQAPSTIVKNFYSALQTSNLDSALGAYDEAFFATRTRDEWRAYLQNLGPLEKFELNSKQSDTRFSGRFFIYQFYTQYKKGKAREIMTLFLPNGSDTIRIVGHKISIDDKKRLSNLQD